MNRETNIGTRIKSLAVSVAACEFLAAVISLLYALFNDFEELPLILGLCGIVVAWPTFLLLCGFGELVEKTIYNEQNTSRIVELLEAKPKTKSSTANTATKAEPSAVQSAPAQESSASCVQGSEKKAQSGVGTIVGNEKVCPNCGIPQRLDRKVCWHCGLKFEN